MPRPVTGGGAGGGGCGPQVIYSELLSAGFSTVQAIGAMANGIAESGLNPELSVPDTNGYVSNGIWMFNEQSYPDSGALVTGNCANDIKQQVGYLASHVSGNALNGSTGAEVAGNFARYFERCQECQPGGASYDSRVGNAATVASWISSGKWPQTGAGGSGNGGNTPAGTVAPSTCLTGEVFGFCPLSKSEARALTGAMCMTAGAMIALPGFLMLAAFAFRASGGANATVNAGTAALERTPGYGHAIRYARGRAQVRAARRAGAAGERTRASRAAGRKTERARIKTRAARGKGP